MPAAQPGTIFALPSIVDRVDLSRVFPLPQPLEVELGSGDGSFLLEWARRNPERNFLGIERLLGRVRKLDRKTRRAGLDNLRSIRIESAYFLEFLLPPHSAEALHIYFPDPWPKRRHERHRLINERFPTIARQALVPGGRIYLRTDSADYFKQMLAVFGETMAFSRVETPANLLEIRTDFEQEFNSQGLATQHAAFAVNQAG